MMTAAEQYRIASTIDIPEIRASVAQIAMDLDEKSHRLTLLALLSFHRKCANDLSVETDGNILKSRLMASGVLYFGSMFGPSEATKAQRIAALAHLGMAVDHLAFLNAEQVELFFTYVCETGLVANL